MASQQDILLTLKVSTILGSIGDAISFLEPAIDEAMKVTDLQEIEHPANESIPLMRQLLKSAKEFAAAHRVIMQWVDLQKTGNMIVEGSDKIQ